MREPVTMMLPRPVAGRVRRRAGSGLRPGRSAAGVVLRESGRGKADRATDDRGGQQLAQIRILPHVGPLMSAVAVILAPGWRQLELRIVYGMKSKRRNSPALGNAAIFRGAWQNCHMAPDGRARLAQRPAGPQYRPLSIGEWTHMTRQATSCSLALLLRPASAAAAAAASRERRQQRPEAFEALVRCRAITEDAARLHCFDAAAAALQAAAERRDVVVVDRAAGPREPAAAVRPGLAAPADLRRRRRRGRGGRGRSRSRAWSPRPARTATASWMVRLAGRQHSGSRPTTTARRCGRAPASRW